MRYLLDTNVVSELRKGPARAAPVTAWARGVDSADLGVSALVLGEVRYGIELIRRRGDRRQAELFSVWLEQLKVEFIDRVLPISGAIAECWGVLRGQAPLPVVDGLMAATALVHDLTLVTRDIAPLTGTGARLLNPWNT